MKYNEIKFRVWNDKTKTFGLFSFSNFFISGHDDYGDPRAQIPTWRYKKGAFGEMGMYYEFDIDDSEVEDYIYQMYTGLKDKNGKEIYEGDIVRFTSDAGTGMEYFTEEVFFSGGNFYPYNTGSVWESNSEIIGNVYENPELLKEKK